MSIEVKVPSVGESITSGILGSWKQDPGSYVKKGDVLFEIETDKVTSEVVAEESGTLEQLVGEGDEVEIGQVVAKIDETAQAPEKEESDNGDSSEAKKEKSGDQDSQTKGSGESSSDKRESSSRKKKSDSFSSPSEEQDFNQSPAVRKLAVEKNIDLKNVEGSGKGGRILKEDVMRAAQGGSKDSSGKDKESAGGKKEGEENRTTRKRMSALRRKVAQRLVSAQHQAAMLTTFNEVDMSNVLTLRKKFQDRFVEKHGIKLGFMSFFVEASIYALKEVPGLNARLEGNDIVQNHFYDIGIAISTAKGLMVPVLRDADRLGMAGIEQEIVNYAGKAKEGKIAISDLEGGVFTITNGGIFGSMLSTPILNPPQSGILGMHTIQERPVAVDGRVEIRPMMYLALTYDHRIVDGKEAVTFLVRVKEFIEQPALMGLELH